MTTLASPATLVVVWRITEVCNLGCPFCGYSRHLHRPRADADVGQVKAFGELLSHYARSSSRDVLVSWLGGEPLRWPPLLDLACVFKRDFKLRLGVTTNGTALTSEVVRRQLVENFDELTLSLDGPPDLHNRLRDAPGLYDQLDDSLTRLRSLKEREKRPLHLHVNVVLMRDNVHLFEDICRRAAGWGAEKLTFNGLGGRDRPEFFRDHRLLPGDVARLKERLPGLRARMAKLGLTICGSERYLERLTSSAENRAMSPAGDPALGGCQPGRHFLFIDERGAIGPCSFTARDYGFSINMLRSADDLSYLLARLAERMRRQPLKVCLDCPSTQVFGKFLHDCRRDD